MFFVEVSCHLRISVLCCCRSVFLLIIYQQWGKRRFSPFLNKDAMKNKYYRSYLPKCLQNFASIVKEKKHHFFSSLFPFWTGKRDDNSNHVAGLDVVLSARCSNSPSVLHSTEWFERKFSAGQSHRTARDPLRLVSSPVWLW